MTLARLIEAVADESATITSEMLGALPTHPEVPVRRLVLNIIHNGKDMNSALALHDALLLGWTVDNMGQRAGGWLVQLGRFDGKTPRPAPEAMIRDNPARAWLLAILRAMEGLE